MWSVFKTQIHTGLMCIYKLKQIFQFNTCIAVLLVSLLNSNILLANEEKLPFFEISYAVENNYVSAGNAIVTFRPFSEKRLVLELETKPKGIFTLLKAGRITESAIYHADSTDYLPTIYTYTDIYKSERDFSVRFDRKEKNVVLEKKDDVSTHDVDSMTVDRLSMTLWMIQVIDNNPETKSFRIPVFHQSSYLAEFKNMGREILKTEKGKVEVIRLEQSDGSTSPRKYKTITWLSKKEKYGIPVPIKIEQFKNDELEVRLIMETFR